MAKVERTFKKKYIVAAFYVDHPSDDGIVLIDAFLSCLHGALSLEEPARGMALRDIGRDIKSLNFRWFEIATLPMPPKALELWRDNDGLKDVKEFYESVGNGYKKYYSEE